MKRILLALALLAPVPLGLVGCGHNVVTTTPAPLPTNAINAFDATSNRVLVDAHTAVQSIRDDAAAKTINLTADQKAVFNSLITDLNTAQHLYKAYHSGLTTDTVGLSSAIQSLVHDLGVLAPILKGGK